ncbi:MAG: helix-turn-helix transcriptional regulator [Acidobacteria bacterium]|nr:helix-turn-helix transcriptional regulator [Acidobacteriota bacterium]
MSAERLLLLTQAGSEYTISARAQLLFSLRDAEYRHEFVKERVRSSVALQIRALRLQRDNMTQKQLGDAIGMAQTWVSKLENPEYGKMTVATLLRLAEAFDTDLEIKFRPFSRTVDMLSRQGTGYYEVPSFEEEFGSEELTAEDIAKVRAIQERTPPPQSIQRDSAQNKIIGTRNFCSERTEGLTPLKKSASMAAVANQEQYGSRQGSTRQSCLAV